MVATLMSKAGAQEVTGAPLAETARVDESHPGAPAGAGVLPVVEAEAGEVVVNQDKTLETTCIYLDLATRSTHATLKLLLPRLDEYKKHRLCMTPIAANLAGLDL